MKRNHYIIPMIKLLNVSVSKLMYVSGTVDGGSEFGGGDDGGDPGTGLSKPDLWNDDEQ